MYTAFRLKMTNMALPLCLVLDVDSCAVKCKVWRLMFGTQHAAGMLSNKLALCESPSDWVCSSSVDPPWDMIILPRLCRHGKWNTFSALQASELRQISQDSCSFSCKQYFTKKKDGLDQRVSTFLVWNLRIEETPFPQKLSQRTDLFGAIRGDVSILKYVFLN
jgi:hypothetical protein